MATDTTSPGLETDAFTGGNSGTSAQTGLPANIKKRLGVSAAALLLGGGAALAFMPPSEHEPNLKPENETDDTETVLPPNAEVANGVNDSMSFDTAFATARDEVGMGGVFMWHKQPYNTFLKEEWASLSLQQRQEYAEHVLGTPLPVSSEATVLREVSQAAGTSPTPDVQPTITEGTIGDRRVMGIDQDNDGIIDVLIIEGEDGYMYSVADASGDEGLDTMYIYDTMKDEYVLAAKLDEPIMLTNDDFNAKLEDAMSKEAVDAIMADPAVETADDVDSAPEDDTDDMDSPEPSTEAYEVDGYGDTYVNNADVNDMDDPHQ